MKKLICVIFFLGSLLLEMTVAQVVPKTTVRPKPKKSPKSQFGTASFYHNKFNGRKTASGAIFNQQRLTAAHNHVPLGTWLKITNPYNNRFVLVKVIDRLHNSSRRLVDLSKAAARKIGFSSVGLLHVKVEIVGKNKLATTTM